MIIFLKFANVILENCLKPKCGDKSRSTTQKAEVRRRKNKYGKSKSWSIFCSLASPRRGESLKNGRSG